MKKAIIDVETLEVWESLTECAAELKVSIPAIIQAIAYGYRIGGGRSWNAKRKLEYFDYWLESYTKAEKEKFTRKNNIFWL